jgi:hypothetical protein
MMIEDVAGRPVPAMKVFGTSIKALMDHMFLSFTARGEEIEPKDIRWVLTVPAIGDKWIQTKQERHTNLFENS